MNGGEVLVETLRSRQVDAVFFVAGGTFVTVLEALSRRRDEIRAVQMRLESSAVFAAGAHAALRRRPACVFVSRAPGAANATIGVHDAMQASRPLVLFVASIPGAMKQREAFQEIDFGLMYAPVAKAVFEVHSFDELANVTARALDLAVSGRPGPVVVVVSRDILDGPTGDPVIPRLAAPVRAGPDPGALAEAVALLRAAAHPLVVAGEMVSFEGAHEALAAFAAASGAGVLAAYRQQDALPNDHLAWLGQLALNRAPHVEQALDECDLLLVAGSRLDSVTTADYTMMRDDQRLVMIYPEPGVFSQWQPDVALASNVLPALEALTAACEDGAATPRTTWRAELHQREAAFSEPGEMDAHGDVNMARVIEAFAARVPADAVLVADAGTFGRWVQRYYRYTSRDTSLGPVSGGMGYGVPAGVGAALAAGDRPVFVWVGDGGFQMTGHEAATIVQEGLPVKIIVCDNAAWGSILVYEQKRFPGMSFGTRLRSPDFAMLARGYGMASYVVERSEAFAPALEAAISEPGPALIHLRLDARDASPFGTGGPIGD